MPQPPTPARQGRHGSAVQEQRDRTALDGERDANDLDDREHEVSPREQAKEEAGRGAEKIVGGGGFALELLERCHVAVTPGAAFGANAEGYLRFSYAASLERIEEGLRRLGRFLTARA